jgi:MFS family permease
MGIAVACFSLTLSFQPSQSGTDDGDDSETGQDKKISYLNLFFFFSTAVLLGITYRGTMTFLPAYIGQEVHLSFIRLDAVTVGGSIATIALLFGGIGQYTSGHLVDKYKPEQIYFWVTLVGTVWVFLMAKSSNLLLILSAILFAMFYFATQPVQNYIITNYLPKHRRGLGFGLYFFLAFSVGSTAAAISGYLADRFGLTSVFYCMGGSLVLSTLMAGLLLLRTRSAITK